MGKEYLLELCGSAMGELGKLSVDVSGAGCLPNSSSYPFGALHLNIPNNYLILAF